MNNRNTPLSWGVYTRVSEFISDIDKGSVDYYIGMVFLQKLQDFPDIYIEEIAWLANTTKSSVTKFCQKIGYASFAELKNDTSEYSEESFFSWFNTQSFSSLDEYTLAVNTADKIMMERTRYSLDEEMIREAASAIRKAHRVVFLADEYNKNIVSIFGEMLLSYEIILASVSRRNSEQESLNAVKRADVVMTSSLSGAWVDSRRDMIRQIREEKPFFIISKHETEFRETIWPVNSAAMRKLGSFYETQKFLQTIFLLLNYYILKEYQNEKDA